MFVVLLLSLLLLLLCVRRGMSSSKDKKRGKSVGHCPAIILKHCSSWTACYDKEKNRFLGHICHSDREGQMRWTYEITQSVFDALDQSDESNRKNEDLIKSGRLMALFENTVHGTLRPEMVSIDEEGEEAWKTAYSNAMKELESRFDAGDESTFGFWEEFIERAEDKERRKHFLLKGAENGIVEAQKELAHAYCYGCEDKYGIELDIEKGTYWSELAAEKGSAQEQSLLAQRFCYGCQVKQSFEKAIYWYSKAAEKGSDDARMQLLLLRAKYGGGGKIPRV